MTKNTPSTDIASPEGMNRRSVLQLGAGLGLALTLPMGASPAFAAGKDTLTIAIPTDVGGWDQDFLAFQTIGLAMMKNTYPFMLDYGTRKVAGGEITDTETTVPLYADSFTSSEDGKVWTLKLKQGIKFPSGNELTAHDVKWSKDRAFAAKANVYGIYRIIGLTEPDQVKVIDDYTVEFTQTHASALTPQIQIISLYVYDSELLKSHATDDDPWAQKWANKTPQDGGAYNVKSYRPGEEIVLEANPNFPGPAPAVKTVHLQVVASAANRRLMLQNGDIDMAMGLDRRDIQDLKSQKGVKVLSAANNEFIFLPLNTQVAPFDKPEVRRALAMAIPYDQLIKSVWNGDARRGHSPIPLDMPGYSPKGYPFEYEPKKAKQALADAGYPKGFETSIMIPSGDEDKQRIAIILQAALKQIGVTLKIEKVDPATLQERRQKHEVPMQVASGQLWVNDVEYLTSTSLTKGSFLNYANYSSPEIDKLLEQMQGTTDPTARGEISLKIQEVLAKDVPWLIIAQPNYDLPVSENVSGWVQPVDGLFRLRYLKD